MKEQLIKEKLTQILDHFDVSPNLKIEKTADDAYDVVMDGNDLSFLIGYHGKALQALQTILGLILYKETGEWTKLSVDVNGYKDKRVEKLQELTKKYIDRVRFFKGEVEMPTMSAWERRQIHIFAAEYDDIITESTGEGRDRRVVLKLK